jgi:transposase
VIDVMGTSRTNHIQGKKGRQFSEVLRTVSPAEILIVAIDAAKLHQKALICNYFGDIIERSFFFSVNKQGMQELMFRIDKAAKEINAKHIVIGVEVTGHYHEDIVRVLGAQGYPVHVLNAYTTSQERNSTLNKSKTDDLDLKVIVKALAQNKATESVLPEGDIQVLQTLTRSRRTLVTRRSSLQTELRNLSDKIWREFQGFVLPNGKDRTTEKLFSDFFGKSSLYFLEHCPHPSMILKLGEKGLKDIAIKNKLKFREDTISKLLYIASESVSRPVSELRGELYVLKMKVEEYRFIQSQVEHLDREIEYLLLQTEGSILLTVPGIGLITAAEFYSEMGDISNYDSAHKLIKKAGTNPVVYQTGGKKGYYGKISKQGNSHFRYIVYLIGKSLAMHNPDLKEFYHRLKSKGKHSRSVYIALGNKFIKIAYALLRDAKAYQSSQENYSSYNEMRKKLKYTSSKTLKLLF